MRGAFTALVLLVVVGLVVISGAGRSFPMLDLGGWTFSWDNSAEIARINAQQVVDLANIAADKEVALAQNETVRLAILLLASLAMLAAGLFTLVKLLLFAMTMVPSDQPPLVIVTTAQPWLARHPDWHLEKVDGEWAVVSERENETLYLPVEELPAHEHQMQLLEDFGASRGKQTYS